MNDSVGPQYIERDGADAIHSHDAASGSNFGAVGRNQTNKPVALITNVISSPCDTYYAMVIVLRPVSWSAQSDRAASGTEVELKGSPTL